MTAPLRPPDPRRDNGHGAVAEVGVTRESGLPANYTPARAQGKALAI